MIVQAWFAKFCHTSQNGHIVKTKTKTDSPKNVQWYENSLTASDSSHSAHSAEKLQLLQLDSKYTHRC